MRLLMQIETDYLGRYQATCVDLPGCVVVADSEAEARLKLRHAVAGYLASMNVSRPYHLHEMEADDLSLERRDNGSKAVPAQDDSGLTGHACVGMAPTLKAGVTTVPHAGRFLRARTYVPYETGNPQSEIRNPKSYHL